MNCVCHYVKDCDYDRVHTDDTETSTEYTQNSTTVDGTQAKPHYVYDARTGHLREKK